MKNNKEIPAKAAQELMVILKSRFEKNMNRHKGIDWAQVEARLKNNSGKLWSISEMEKTGGEPDVIGMDKKTGEVIFCDCSAESPAGRRSVCYDKEGLDSRKEFKPAHAAMDMAYEMGLQMLNEEQYRELQKLGKFDAKTSSWLRTTDSIRDLGGAIFGDFRFGQVFVYHNGAQSYYSGRGFRGLVRC